MYLGRIHAPASRTAVEYLLTKEGELNPARDMTIHMFYPQLCSSGLRTLAVPTNNCPNTGPPLLDELTPARLTPESVLAGRNVANNYALFHALHRAASVQWKCYHIAKDFDINPLR